MKKGIYSYALRDKIDAELPQCVKDAMSNSGWNAFGVYELVKREIAKELRAIKREVGVK